jgi:hypothetical protein
MTMGKFREIAEQIARRSLEEKITLRQLPEILHRDERIGHNRQGNDGQETINCYPGSPGDDQCHPFAAFISLSANLRSDKSWPNFHDILDLLARYHFQGRCQGKSREGLIITDTWESWAFEKWKANIENIQKDGVYLEFYLIGKGWVTEIPI